MASIIAGEETKMWDSHDSDDMEFVSKETTATRETTKSDFKKVYTHRFNLQCNLSCIFIRGTKVTNRNIEKDGQFKNWLQPIHNNPDKAYCKLCGKQLLYENTNKQLLTSQKEALYGPKTQTLLVNKKQERLARYKWLIFLLNIIFLLMLVPQLFPDSHLLLFVSNPSV